MNGECIYSLFIPWVSARRSSMNGECIYSLFIPWVSVLHVGQEKLNEW